MRKRIDGLMALVQSSLRQTPATGSVFAFRGRQGDRIKRLFWDGQGFCLYYEVLEKGRFPWPSASDGTARLTAAQLAMLREGIDSRRRHRSSASSRCRCLPMPKPADAAVPTYFNWKKKYAGLLPLEIRKLKQTEDENARLKKLIAVSQLAGPVQAS